MSRYEQSLIFPFNVSRRLVHRVIVTSANATVLVGLVFVHLKIDGVADTSFRSMQQLVMIIPKSLYTIDEH